MKRLSIMIVILLGLTLCVSGTWAKNTPQPGPIHQINGGIGNPNDVYEPQPLPEPGFDPNDTHYPGQQPAPGSPVTSPAPQPDPGLQPVPPQQNPGGGWSDWRINRIWTLARAVLRQTE